MLGDILENVESWDFTSSYPYVLVTHKFPSNDFQPCKIQRQEQMIDKFAYLLVVEFENITSKYYNNFISASKCTNLYNADYDNGRVIRADKLTMTLTDIDFYFILDTYKIEKYTIIESYYSLYDYMPKTFIEFTLEKYINKTKYKNVEGMEVEYAKEKNKFNSLYGMSVTNTIRDEVTYDSEKDWIERELTNNEILEKLLKEKDKGFLSFAYGVWVTAHARNNLLRNLIALDEYVIYSDTDSLKLKQGYNKKIIDEYNKKVIEKIKNASEILEIPIEHFAPKDSEGISHMLGVFENDGEYAEFITQGAKKYAYTKWIDNKKVKENANIQEVKGNKTKVLEITVAGVPKERSNSAKKFT